MGHDRALATEMSSRSFEGVLPLEEYLLARSLSQKTVKDYSRELSLATAWFEANRIDMEEAMPSQLIAYAETRPNSPSVRGQLRSALKYWWDWRGVQGWPGAIAVPTVPNMTCKALEDDQARLLFTKAEEIGWRAGTAVEVMLSLALRNEECASMRWDGLSEDWTSYTLVGKRNKQRTLPVAPELAAKLNQHRTDSPWVFEGRNGGYVSHQTINNWVQRVAREAGLTERVYPHRLRHTSLASMNDDTKDLRTTQEFAGHSRPETTSGYTRTTRKRMESAAVSLYQKLAGGVWLHSTLPGGQPDVSVGTGNEPWTVRAVCDPPGEDSLRPFCWHGPDRDTVEEAVADAKTHAPGVEPDVLQNIWPDSDPLQDLLRPTPGERLASVVVLHPKVTGVASRHQQDDDQADNHEQQDHAHDDTETGTRVDPSRIDRETDLIAGEALGDSLEASTFDLWTTPEPVAHHRNDDQRETQPKRRLEKEPLPAAPNSLVVETEPRHTQRLDDTAASISAREREVLQLMALGISGTDDLANRLGIAPKTVKNHLSSIYKKLSVHDRTQAVVEALKHGMVDPTVQSRRRGGVL